VKNCTRKKVSTKKYVLKNNFWGLFLKEKTLEKSRKVFESS
jgi:hypothetical protein